MLYEVITNPKIKHEHHRAVGSLKHIGAYGVEVKDVIEEVYAIELVTGEEKVFTNTECEYDYRKSIFKTDLKGQYIITSVTFKLSKATSFKLGYRNNFV